MASTSGNDWLSAGASLLGGLLAGNEKAPTQTQSSSLNAQVAPYVYGGNGVTGVLPSAADWFSQNKSGLNPQMAEGLNRQYNVYSDPNIAQGYTNQQSLGQALLSAPIAGNPFTGGGSTVMAPQTSSGVQPVSYSNPANVQSNQVNTNPYIYSAPGGGGAAQAGGGTPGVSVEGISPLVGRLTGKLASQGWGNSTPENTAMWQAIQSGQFGDSMGSSSTPGSFGGFGNIGSTLSGLGITAENVGSVLGGLAGGPLGSLAGRAIGGLLGSSGGSSEGGYNGPGGGFGGGIGGGYGGATAGESADGSW